MLIKKIDRLCSKLQELFNPLVPNQFILDFGMPNGQKDIKIDQIGTVMVKCDVLSIPAISSDPKPLEKFLQRVEKANFFNVFSTIHYFLIIQHQGY